jgi:hypothetical protein
MVRTCGECSPRWNIEGVIVHEVGYWLETSPWLELYRPAEGINNCHAKDRSFDPRLYCRSFHVSRANLDSLRASE